MSMIRQDAWTNDEDLILAEVVLRHIREGSTQLAAFEEVGERLQRTSAACGFRWNSTIRKKYEAAITLAKKQRKKGKLPQEQEEQANYEVEASQEIEEIPLVNSVPEEEEIVLSCDDKQEDSANMTLDEVIQFLQQYASKLGQQNVLEGENKKLKQENEKLKESNEKLKKEIKAVKKEKETINEDYRTLINIMDRARKMAVLPEENSTN